MGKKIIYIESFARVHNPSLTGRLVYKIADLFIVQWEDMLKVYDKAVLGGGFFDTCNFRNAEISDEQTYRGSCKIAPTLDEEVFIQTGNSTYIPKKL